MFVKMDRTKTQDQRPILHISTNAFHRRTCFVFVICIIFIWECCMSQPWPPGRVPILVGDSYLLIY